MSDPARDLIVFMAAHIGEIPEREFYNGLVSLQAYIDALGEIEIPPYDPSLTVHFLSSNQDEKATLKFQNIDALANWGAQIMGQDTCNHQNQKPM